MPLTVIYPFDGHQTGDTILDAAEISQIETDERARFVVRTADDAPEPEIAPTAEAPANT